MRYFWGLDLLRFIAAAMVVLFHFSSFGHEFGPLDPANGPMGWLFPTAWFGWVGVQIFFVLSGFIISASAENSTAVSFLQKRAIRILPVLWISTLAALSVRVVMGEQFGELVPVFLKTIFLSPRGPYMDGVVWTLVVEAFFYLTVAIAILLARRLKNTSQSLFIMALALGSASTAFNLCNFLAGQGDLLPIAIHPEAFRWFGFDVALLRHGVFFAVGILIYLQFSRGIPNFAKLALAVFALACMVQISFLVRPTQNAAWPIGAWFAATLLTYLGARYGDRLVKRDVRRFMRPVGLLTYPFYLNHYILGQALLPLVSSLIAGPFALLLAMSAILLLNAWLIAVIPEPWIQNLGRQLIAERKQSQLRQST